jgi:hypothetical protein
MAVQSKEEVRGRSIAGVAVSDPAGGTEVR